MELMLTPPCYLYTAENAIYRPIFEVKLLMPWRYEEDHAWRGGIDIMLVHPRTFLVQLRFLKP